MFKKTVLVAGLSLISVSAFAGSHSTDIIPLKSGATLYVFENGKMGMEDKYGRAGYMDQGTVMETESGEKVTMVGNEAGRMRHIVFWKNGGPTN